MKSFILKRLAFIVPQILVLTVGTFLVLRLLPIDPVGTYVGGFGTDEQFAQVEHQFGLDKSIPEQLGSYGSSLLRGGFGDSWSSNESVGQEILTRFPVTIQLITLAFALALLIAIPIGRAAATRPGKPVDKATQWYALFAGAQPDFWWGLVFIFGFFFTWKIFPAPIGLYSTTVSPPADVTHFILIDALIAADLATFWDVMSHLALPVITLAFVLTGPLVKMTREGCLEVVNADYILHARAMGLPARAIRRHILRNSLAPVLTLTSVLFGYMLGGAVLVEYIFSLDGLGSYALSRTLAVDFPSVQGAVIVMATFSLLNVLFMDILHAALDPRVRVGSA